VPLASGCKHNNLLELQARRLGESEDSQPSKLFAQQSRAFWQSQLWNHKKQHATRFEPAIGVFQKYGFQSLIVTLAKFPIVRRIQVEQRHRFRRATGIHRVGLEGFDSQASGLFGSIGVNLNSIAIAGHVLKQISECNAIADAGIERRESLGKGQPILESFGLGYRKREKA
jgi:hypothetical protein